MPSINDLFGPKSTDAMHSMALREILPMISSVGNTVSMNKAIENFSQINHPTVQYYLATKCLTLGMREKARHLYISGAKHGLRSKGRFYNTPHHDSMGQCLTYLLTQFRLSGSKPVIEKATALAYFHLSAAILAYKDKAFDSRIGRVRLIEEHNDTIAAESILSFLFPNQRLEVLLIADLCNYAYHYVNANRDIVRETMSRADKLHYSLDDLVIFGKEASLYAIEELADLGDTRHRNAFLQEVIPSLNADRYTLTVEELEEVIN